ncbi:F-box protein CPR1 [Citrus sinensis]|uniref:F-box protein CPR1 n=1 Tax=Citrus sinensis TaxID=2711 RepID=A0ACB8ITN5_CITSI|nr:F-box protein CPR1 [Citrus sinensis]
MTEILSRLPVNPLLRFSDIKIFGYCNGLFAVKTRPKSKEIALWNPSTRKHRILAKCYSDDNGSHECVNGLGYDAASDDYNSDPEVAKYDLMVAFDPKSEELYQVPLPPVEDDGYFDEVDDFRGCLCLTRDYDMYEYNYQGPFGTWMMKEYGVMESWTQSLTSFSSSTNPLPFVKPLTRGDNFSRWDEIGTYIYPIKKFRDGSKTLFYPTCIYGTRVRLANFQRIPSHLGRD